MSHVREREGERRRARDTGKGGTEGNVSRFPSVVRAARQSLRASPPYSPLVVIDDDADTYHFS